MLIIISGPAGVGKNTIITEILNKTDKIKLLQTCTTRPPRSTDKDMHNPYIYLTANEFEQKIKNGELFEHEQIHNNYYGMLNISLKEVQKGDFHYIKDIGVLGQINIKKALNGKAKVLSIFLTAPKEELIKRLQNRGDKDLQTRISRIDFEMSHAKNYDHVIENLNKDQTIQKILTIIHDFDNQV